MPNKRHEIVSMQTEQTEVRQISGKAVLVCQGHMIRLIKSVTISRIHTNGFFVNFFGLHQCISPPYRPFDKDYTKQPGLDSIDSGRVILGRIDFEGFGTILCWDFQILISAQCSKDEIHDLSHHNILIQ